MPTSKRALRAGVDVNGCPTEEITVDGQVVRIHFDDIPADDITTVDGVRCTTPLRTVIDLAAEFEPAELDAVVRHCLDRGLFTTGDALTRLDRPDVSSRRGARLLRAWLEQ